ncbi:MAG: acetyl-CoA acetyltransferase [Gammaproteobacteria bacterium]
MLDPNTPVIVGVGQICERLDSPDYRALSPVNLAAEAARRALDDALAADRLAPHVDAMGAVRTFEDSSPRMAMPFGKSNNFPWSVARRLGAAPRKVVWEIAGGQSPQHLLSEFAEKIAAGEVHAALLFGAEAISTGRDLMAKKAKVDWSETVEGEVEDRGPGTKGMITRTSLAHKLFGAPPQYALFEHARRRRMRLSRKDYADEMGRLFAPLSAVAAANPYSSSGTTAYTGAQLVTVTERNRMIADPYPRLLVARDQVNQGAAVLLMSAGKARELGIPQAKWVYLHGYADLTEREIMDRADLGASPAARAACNAALKAAGIGMADVRYIDLYSCFPIAVFNVCDAFGLSPDDPRKLTQTGGLPYFGGAGNNYSMHGICEIAARVRSDPGSYGFVGANGGALSKYSVGIYSTRAAAFRKQDCKPLQAELDAIPGPRIAQEADGWATIETFTIVHDREKPAYAVVIGRLEGSGDRFMANTYDGDAATLQQMIDEDPLDRRVYVRSYGFGNRIAFDRAHHDLMHPPRPKVLRADYKYSLVERRGHVLEVTINRPESRNCLHPMANEELEEIFDAFMADPSLWIAILAGAGTDAFCTGNDLKYSASGKPVYVPKTGFAGLTHRRGRDKPVIAAVNGYAMGGGFEIALACDLVVADASAQFALSEVRVGLIAGAGGLVRLPRQIPRKVATEMILTGRRVGAEEGQRLGFVNRVTPAGQALAEARRLADEILEGSPVSVRLSLAHMNETAQFAAEADAVAHNPVAIIDELLTAEDTMEGMIAFAQKRKPAWKNR